MSEKCPSDTHGLCGTCVCARVYPQTFVEKYRQRLLESHYEHTDKGSQHTIYYPVEELWWTRGAISHAFTVNFISMLVCRWNRSVVLRIIAPPSKPVDIYSEGRPSWAVHRSLSYSRAEATGRCPSVLSSACVQHVIGVSPSEFNL